MSAPDNQSRTAALRKSASVLAIVCTALLAAPYVTEFVSTPAFADSHTEGEGGKGEGGKGGNEDAGHSDESGHAEGEGSGKGPMGGEEATSSEGEPDSDSDGRGPEYGKPEEPDGGKPAWAQEGIPEVELGRLNVARSPEHVLDQAFEEALASLTTDMVTFYNMSLDEAITALSLNFDDLSFIDSPLQNLSLLKDALDGTSTLNTIEGISNDVDVLTAMFLGTASDKTVEITTETAIAVATILGYDLTSAEAEALAADAEAIRIAVLAGHG